MNVEIPPTLKFLVIVKSLLISPFPFRSNSVTVAIPVLMLGTSSSPNNLPVNTTSPLIVWVDAAPTIAPDTVNLSNTWNSILSSIFSALFSVTVDPSLL